MGLDLTLLPVDFEEYRKNDDGVVVDWGFSHSLLSVTAGRWWDDALREGKVTLTPVPKDFATFYGRGADGEPAYRNTQETPYGDPLMCTTVGELLTAVKTFLATNDKEFTNIGPKNRAVLAYLAELNATQRVALYWH